MKLISQKFGFWLLAPFVVFLAACGSDNRNPNSADVNQVGVASAPDNGTLTTLLDQGVVNAEALDLDDATALQTEDNQDAFDL